MTPDQQALADLSALNTSVPALVTDYQARGVQIAALTEQVQALTGGNPPIQVCERTLVPEDYGAVGDGVTDDTAALQACHDALAAIGGGTMMRTAGKVYGITEARDANGNALAKWSNQYATRWGLNLWGDNITLDGEGEIRLLRKPAASLPMPGFPNGVAAYVPVLGGRLHDQIRLRLADCPATFNLRILNGRFSTADSITDADLESLNSGISGLIMMAHVVGFQISHTHCTGGFGHIGVVGAHVGSENGEVSDNFIQARKKIVNPANGAWASLAGAGFCGDGLRYSRILRNTITDVLNGIGFNANADNQRAPMGLLVAENTILDLKGVGLYATGAQDVQISRNTVRSTVGYAGGVRLISMERVESGGAVVHYPNFGAQVSQNTFEYAGPGTGRIGIGLDVISKLGALPANESAWHDFNRNTLIRMSKAFHLDTTLCHDIRGAGNVFNGAVNQFDDPAIPALNSIQGS